MSWFGNPAAISSLADRLARDAAELDRVAHHLATRADSVRWRSQRGDRWRAETHARAETARSLARDLRAIAADLRRLAGRVTGQMNFFRMLERRVREAIRTTGDLSRYGIDPRRLPPAGHPDWANVGRKLGIR